MMMRRDRAQERGRARHCRHRRLHEAWRIRRAAHGVGQYSPRPGDRPCQARPGYAGAAAPDFPTGVKWGSSPRTSGRIYSVSTPTRASRAPSKTATILVKRPHQLIEAIAICGVRHRRQPPSSTCAASITSRRADAAGARRGSRAGLAGPQHPRLGLRPRPLRCTGAGAYKCGEETALLESLEGKRGMPRSSPLSRPSRALWQPTVINNVETLANRRLHPSSTAPSGSAGIGTPRAPAHGSSVSAATSSGPAITSCPWAFRCAS